MKKILERFIGKSQLSAVRYALRGEEAEGFKSKMDELAGVIENMPKVYEQDGKGDQAIVYLHYFRGGCDWYILEKDNVEDEPQYQAFGYANLGDDDYAELGYISIEELIQNNVELDFYWVPKALVEIKNKVAA